MQIYVCIKHVPDTAAKITVEQGGGFAENIKFILNPYDEYGVEEAVQLAKQTGGEVVIVTVGKEAAQNTMRSALALGADRGILVKSEAQFLDSAVTSMALKQAIEQDGKPDVIFTGKQSIDSEGMQTPYRMARAFDMPVVSEVVDLQIADGKAIVERETGAGRREVLEMDLPCIIGATKGLNEPHYPKLPDIMKAKKKEIRQVSLQDLKLEVSGGLTELVDLEPVAERGQARMLDGSPQEMVEALVRVLKEEEKVI